MYAQNDNTVPSSQGMTTASSRAALQTRPRIQRVFIRSWEYIQPVRITILAIRLLVVLWLAFLGVSLSSASSIWGWTLVPAAVAVFAFSFWVFATATKGWQAVKA